MNTAEEIGYSMKIILAWLVMMAAIICCKSCEGSTYEQDVVIATIILEAGGEYHVGALEGVYEVIMTRAEKRNMSPADVCLQKWQFSCWNGMVIKDQIAKAKKHSRWNIAKNILGTKTNYVKGADHYHADYIDAPYWAKTMKKTAVVGQHIFYK